MMRDEAPTLDADVLEKNNLIVWCDHCRGWHTHSLGDGHRAEHCYDPRSPYAASGYNLRSVGPAPAWVRKDHARRRPQGPA
jgi:hypothetical protein